MMRGFTMIEMVIVLAIIGLFAAALTPMVTNYVDKSRVAKAQSDLRTIGEAISRFEKDVGRYPMWSAANALLQDGFKNHLDHSRRGRHSLSHQVTYNA